MIEFNINRRDNLKRYTDRRQIDGYNIDKQIVERYTVKFFKFKMSTKRQTIFKKSNSYETRIVMIVVVMTVEVTRSYRLVASLSVHLVFQNNVDIFCCHTQV